MATTIAFRPILPKVSNYPMDVVDRLEKELALTLNGNIRRSLELSFDRRTFGWKNKPSFRSRFSARAYKGGLTGFSLTTEPFGRNKRIWVFLTAGVPQHTILPKKRRRLTIRGGVGGYYPFTTPGDSYGGVGAYNEAATFQAKRVNHPGIKPRTFETFIAKENESFVFQELSKAIGRALL